MLTDKPLTRHARAVKAARVRWGDQPRVVRLDALTPEQRRLVLALVAAAKSAPETTPPEAT